MVTLKLFTRDMCFHYVFVQWLLSAEVFEYHCSIKNKEKCLVCFSPLHNNDLKSIAFE